MQAIHGRRVRDAVRALSWGDVIGLGMRRSNQVWKDRPVLAVYRDALVLKSEAPDCYRDVLWSVVGS